jgi:hypothetical protein
MGHGRCFALATIAAAVVPFIAHAAPMIDVSGPVGVNVLEGSMPTFLFGTFTVTNRDPTGTATITGLTLTTSFLGGDETDVVSEPTIATGALAPPTPCMTGTNATILAANGGSCNANIVVMVPAITPGENMDVGATQIELTATTKEGLVRSDAGIIALVDPIPEPDTLSMLVISISGLVAANLLRRSRIRRI